MFIELIAKGISTIGHLWGHYATRAFYNGVQNAIGHRNGTFLLAYVNGISKRPVW